MVFGAIPLIQRLQPDAGILSTFKAKPDEPFPYQIALVFHEQAVFTAGQAAGAVLLVESLLIQVVFHRQVMDA
jgi:hypothetical protein